jgi:hypothetical protein
MDCFFDKEENLKEKLQSLQSCQVRQVRNKKARNDSGWNLL